MKKVLIFTETIAGNGHYRAARSLEKALTQLDPAAHVKIVNGMALVSQRLESAVRRGYLKTLRFAPKLWGKAYDQENKLSDLFQAPLGQILSHYLQEVFLKEKPDVVVCTHAFCLGAVAQLKAEHAFQLGAAVTDFDVNGFWLHEEVDFYFVGHARLQDKIRASCPDAEVFATGIPIDPLFAEISKLPKEVTRRKAGLQTRRPTLLLMGGAMGLGPLDSLIQIIVDHFADALQIIVVTGRNELLRKKCEETYKAHPYVHILGYVDELAHYMAASHLVITKPGGLTSSEAMALGLPILIIQPIPGHEERNTRFLLEQRVALHVEELGDVPRFIRPFVKDPQFYGQFTARVRKAGKPASARHAAEIILKKAKAGISGIQGSSDVSL